MGIFSIVFMIHIFCYLVIFKPSGVASNTFFNNMLTLIYNSSAKYLAIPVFCSMGYYWLFCAQKGNVKLGLRLGIVSFYTIVKHETFSNSFFANCILLNLYSVAVTQLTI